MTEIKIGFTSILRHKYLAMLVGTHRPRVDIDIGVQLHCTDLQTSCFQQSSQGCCTDALPQTGHNTAAYKYKFTHI